MKTAASLTIAALAALSSSSFVLAQEAAPATPATTAAGHAADPLTAERYRTTIENLEHERGPYDPALGETLLSLGLVLQHEGRDAEALDALNRALHIHRVNEGLQSMTQVPILDALIKSNVATENWEELDKNYHQLLWTYRRNYDPSDEALLPVIERVGSWKVRAYTEDLLKQGGYSTLEEAERMYTDTVKIMEDKYGESDPRLISPLYGVAVTQYQLLIESQNKPLREFSRMGSPTRSYLVCRTDPRTGQTYCTTVQGINPDYYADAERTRQFEQSRIIGKAGAALEQISAIYGAHPELPARDHAAALVHYGDWNLVMRRRSTAMEAYKQAIHVLQASPEDRDEIEALFGVPKQIPSLTLPLPEVDAHQAQKTPEFVQLRLDVSEAGAPRNVEVVESSDPDDRRARREAKRDIRSRIFRPRFVNGEPAATEGLKFRWVVK